MPLLPSLNLTTICYFKLLIYHLVQLNKLLLYLINLTFMIDVIYRLITNNSLHTFLNNFASNSSYQNLSERAELTAHSYKFLYNSDISIPRYLHSKIIMNFCIS